jgi:hypothetical protein
VGIASLPFDIGWQLDPSNLEPSIIRLETHCLQPEIVDDRRQAVIDRIANDLRKWS